MERKEELDPPQACGWIGTASTVALFLADRILDRGGNVLLHRAGIVILISGGLLAFPPMFTLKKHGQVEAGKNYMHTSTVVDRGLFSVVRHPQYLAYVLLNLGFMLSSQRWAVIVLGTLAIAFFYLQAVAEEKYCYGKFGEDYRLYAQRVPRFNLLLGIARRVRKAEGASKNDANCRSPF
jgi:protein-S-isoprenylcysteine O-methyltransferase Ste14